MDTTKVGIYLGTQYTVLTVLTVLVHTITQSLTSLDPRSISMSDTSFTPLQPDGCEKSALDDDKPGNTLSYRLPRTTTKGPCILLLINPQIQIVKPTRLI